ncbi:DUF4442 domain-containing protein [Perlucidibaca piscinae]|uniref:DUF4442 domain-containing protein n=1 Tax=Perlucidibaca piscinae TaxID=392589 RepID=UPI0003B43126|nr:DUF4442 domain-containing protein [Perlucidibaca piscinae]
MAVRATLISRLTRWRLNLYGPYLGAGIRVEHISPDFLAVDVVMRLRPWNRNAVGTHFGGSLYSMVDPFYMLMLMRALGPDYLVWDQAAQIDFLRPGRGRVRAAFRLDADQLRQLRDAAASGRAVRPEYVVEVLDEAGEVVARARKTLYVRLKPARRPPAAAEISAPDHSL